jgi:hypothetical protein
MELKFDIDTWDVWHHQEGQEITLGFLIEQLLEQLNMELVNGQVVPIEDEEE